MTLCIRRRQHEVDTDDLDPDPKPVMFHSNPVGEASSRPYPVLPSAQPTTYVPNTSDVLSTSTVAQDHTSLDYLQPTILEIPVSQANTSSASYLSSFGKETAPNKQSLAISPAMRPSSPVALSTGTSASPTGETMQSAPKAPEHMSNLVTDATGTSAQLTRQPSLVVGVNTSIAQLTDEQIGLLSRLSSANVPAADIARLMERMTSGRASNAQGLDSDNASDGVNLDAAPPSYDVLDI
jgi:hypothetical protein